MAYYMQGDYYLAGDPGLFSFLGKAVKGVAKTAVGIGGAALSLTPAGQAIQMVGRTLTAPSAFQPVGMPSFAQPVSAFRPPTIAPPAPAPSRGTGFGAVPVGVTQVGPGFRQTKAGGFTMRKRPRMNPYNPRALARASRRIESMRKSMSRALKHTNYKIVSKGAGRSGGSRGVITRSEAARALRR